MDANIFKLVEKNQIEFLNNILQKNLDEHGNSAQIYSNLISIIIDQNDLDNPINYALTRPQYFNALNEYQEFNFSHLPGIKPSKVIRNYNKKYLQEIFETDYDAKVDKKLNKYFSKKIITEMIVFLISIKFISFNSSGRLKKIPGHRAMFLYNIKDNFGLFIDPKYNISEYRYNTYLDAVIGKRNISIKGTEEYGNLVINKIVPIVSKILHFPIEAGVFHYTCPQFKVNDKNCVFWTLYLIEELVRAYFEGYNFEEAMDIIYTSNPDKKSLTQLIENYKKNLYREWLFYKSIKRE
jgi:hypothetical protein